MQSGRAGLRPLSLALACGLMVWAQNPTPQSRDQAVEVTGAVTNSVAGEPITRAHVTLLRRSESGGQPQKYSAITNAEGKFSIAKLAPGPYFLTVERVGYTKARGSDGGGDSEVTLGPDEQHRDMTVKMTPCGAISGRVLGANGEPLDSIMAIAERGHMSLNVTTDEKGQFRIDGLAPGRYRVKAVKEEDSLPPEVRTDGTSEIHYTSTYYPSSLSADSATKIQVQPGTETRGIEIRMIGGPVVGILGKVTGIPAGAEDVAVTTGEDHAGEQRDQPVNSDGTFALWRLDPGRYIVNASGHTPNGHDFQTELSDVEVAASNVEHVELRVVQPAVITGRLVFDDEKARQIWHSPDSQTPQPHSQPVELILNDVRENVSTPKAKIGDDDSFRLENVQAGRYHVSVAGMNGVYVKSMRLGQTEIDGSVLDLTHGVTAGDGSGGPELSLSISSATGSVSGTVRSDNGAAEGASVALFDASNDHADTQQILIGPTEPDGTYAFDGLNPGKYKLVAIKRSTIDTDWLADYEDSVQEVQVRAGETVSQDLTGPASGN
jgi:hypothetical protein